MAVRLSGLHASRPLHPRKIPGTHFCYRLSRSQGHSATGRIRLIENSSDLIENRTHYLLACSVVPQRTTLPRAPSRSITLLKLFYASTQVCDIHIRTRIINVFFQIFPLFSTEMSITFTSFTLRLS
jgi:hypothetical protein